MLTFPARSLRLIASAVAIGTLALALAARAQGGEDVPAAITFTGFDEHPDGSSRLYVKLSRAVPFEPTLAGKHLEYLLVGATVPLRNNQNPLITSHFSSQVVSARLVVEGGSKGKNKKPPKVKTASAPEAARLVVETREAVNPDSRMVKNADGSATFIVVFAKPSKRPPPEPDVIAAPPAQK